MNRILIFLVLFTLSFSGFAQDGERGSGAVNLKKKRGVKRALVVGIADYNAESLKLNYSDDDAKIFKEYLEEVEQIPKERLVALIADDSISGTPETQPTSNNILHELKEIEDNTREGDTIFFYFAGHGDVVVNPENKEEGFLLAKDANDNREYFGTPGVVSLKHLNRVITSITDKGAKFVLVLDACRSGFLYKEGTQKNLETFNNNFQNSTKFFSCKPEQLSLESKDIGHGYFTYYLVLGLLGAADNLMPDNNLQYFELSTFLANNVSKETNTRQSPIVWTQYFNEIFVPVNISYKEKAFEALKNSSTMKNIWKSRGIESTVTETLTEIPIIKEFNRALQNENYFGSENSALELYNKAKDQVLVEPEILGRMQYSLVNTLSTDAQILINSYIGNAEFLPGSKTFKTKAKYLTICLDLLRKDDFNYERLLMSKLFLESYAIIRAQQFSKYPEAKAKLRQALKIENRAAYLHNALGIVLNHENNFKEAEYHYRRAMELIPTWSYPFLNLGVNFYEQYQYKNAKFYYEEALDRDQNSYGSILNNLGAISERQGKYNEAEAFYHKVKETDGAYSVTTLRNLGKLYNNRGNIKKAIEYYQMAYDKDPDNVYTLYDYSDIINDYNLDARKPKQMLEKAIEIEPFFSQGYAKYGDYLRRYNSGDEDLKLADSLYNFAIKNDPFYTWAYAGRGWLYEKQGNQEKALQSFNEGIEKNSQKPRPYYYLAGYYKSALGDSGLSEENYLRAVEKDSFYIPAYEGLVDLYNDNDRQEESIDLVNKLLSWNGESPVLYTLLGNTYFDLKDFEKASEAYQKSIDLDATYAKGYTNLAFCLLKNENYDEAVKNFKMAFENNPYKNSLDLFSKLLSSEARKQGRKGDLKVTEHLLVLAKDLIENNETVFKLGEFYYLQDQPEKAETVVSEYIEKQSTRSWKLKYYELATKIAIDLGQKQESQKFTASLNKINPRPDVILNALVLKLNGQNSKARQEINKLNKIMLNETFLKKKYSKNTINLLKQLTK
ncbi:tetratricopeptide repeat protein [Gaetbulibacter aestuarii]|uniref:Tetratricopeptide repeat protein n=1 Tax=Gaetbulibacter aestuarii TaxID=1502358 RepID=A0ABW7N2M2_9FLAO